MGCGASNNAEQVSQPAGQMKKGDNTKTMVGEALTAAGKVLSSAPLIGGAVAACLTAIGYILICLDASQKMPDYLKSCRSKLVHIQQLLNEFEEHKLTSHGITLDYFAELKLKLEDFKMFIEDKLNQQNNKGSLDRFFQLLKSDSDMKKSQEFNQHVDAVLQKFLLAKIHDDVSDTFPEFLKKFYKSKPGYNTWRYLFGNKEKKSKQAFTIRFTQHNELPQNQIDKFVEEMNQDKQGDSIEFEEYMRFVDLYIFYFDEKGDKIRKPDQLLQRISGEVVTVEQTMSDKIINYPDGSKYEGEIVNGQRQGKGVYTKGSNYSYDGEFINDIKQGRGIEVKNGNRYIGDFKSNQREGSGRLEYSDGSIYEGEFKMNLPEGKGKLTDSDNNVYEGTFIDGQMIEGTIMYANQEKYIGQVKSTRLRHGKGRQISKDGKTVFEGNYRDNFPIIRYTYKSPADKANIEKNRNEIQMIDIELNDFNGHDVKLLSNLTKLEIISINFTDQTNIKQDSDLVEQLLSNCHDNVYQKLSDLIVLIPRGDVYQKTTPIVDAIQFTKIFNVITKFKNITLLKLGLTNWGAENKSIGTQTITELVQCYQTFKKLEYLSLDAHGWGYRNSTPNQNDIISIIKGLEQFKGQLKTFELDLGRWGVEDHSNYKFISDLELSKIGALISKQQGLEKLNLNLRSWGYNNDRITDVGLGELFESISMCQSLRVIELQLRGFGYENPSISTKCIKQLISCIPNFIDLERFYINVDIWRNVGCKKNDQIWKDLMDGLNKMPLCREKIIYYEDE